MLELDKIYYHNETMRIADQSVKKLGLVPEARALADAVAALSPDDWAKDRMRQELFSNVHGDTQTMVLLFCDGWPDVEVGTRDAWARLGEFALPVMQAIIKSHYPGKGAVLRAMVARLKPGGHIARHYDAHPSFAAAHRIHVPLVTHPKVRFLIDDEDAAMRALHGYEIDNLRYHEVKNDSLIDRDHFIFDYAPPAGIAGRDTQPLQG
jgi:hypothetical protein